jgi:hypothetical protein
MTEETPDPIVVPHTQLGPDTLRALVESFVLREGTEYGERDFTLEEEVTHVIAQLERGEARIIFDAHSESVNIVAVTPGSARSR